VLQQPAEQLPAVTLTEPRQQVRNCGFRRFRTRSPGFSYALSETAERSTCGWVLALGGHLLRDVGVGV
jgi:hypothetical protein